MKNSEKIINFWILNSILGSFEVISNEFLSIELRGKPLKFSSFENMTFQLNSKFEKNSLNWRISVWNKILNWIYHVYIKLRKAFTISPFQLEPASFDENFKWEWKTSVSFTLGIRYKSSDLNSELSETNRSPLHPCSGVISEEKLLTKFWFRSQFSKIYCTPFHSDLNSFQSIEHLMP